MDKNLQQVTDEFITERVNYHSKHEADVLTDAFVQFSDHAKHLCDTLTEEQSLLFRKCDNAYRHLESECQRFYYKAGFGDAISFLLNWGN